MQARRYANEGSTLALKPRADVTRSQKLGYQEGPNEMDTCSPKILKAKKSSPVNIRGMRTVRHVVIARYAALSPDRRGTPSSAGQMGVVPH